MLKARYDAAQTTEDNKKYWSEADAFSALGANTPEVRRILRNRARYECANNSYCKGMIRTLADDTIGKGPRLQFGTPDATANAAIGEAFQEWADAACLSSKLHTLKQSQVTDGECFILLYTHPAIPGPIQLDLLLVECDQIHTPFPWPLDPRLIDGMTLDDYGNVASYNMLKYHPGDLIMWGFPMDFDVIPAKWMIHYFKRERPHQFRGIPEITPALPLFALLRRFTLATVSAAESAALFAVLLKTSMTPEDADSITPFDTQEIARNMMVALPEGYDATQLHPEHPATTYDMFKSAILNEIARCLNMPFNVAAGNSSSYNYSSGRLDHQVYFKSIDVDQHQIERHILDRILAAWLAEARLALPGLIPNDLAVLPRKWYWDGREHVDPVREATAQEQRLANNTTTLADEWARQGHDWRERLRQRSEELTFMRELGIPLPAAPGASNSASSAPTAAHDSTAEARAALRLRLATAAD